MKIYADVVFIINFFMDTFILWIGAVVIRKKIKIRFLILAGFVASLIYCLFMFLPILSRFYNFFTPIIMISIAIKIAYNPKKIKTFFKQLIIVHICAFAVGGLGMALFYYTNIGAYISNTAVYTVKNLSLKILITTFCCSFILIKIFKNYITNFFLRKESFVELEINYLEKNFKLTALVDTGNSLKDPLTGAHVIVANFSCVKPMLPESVQLLFYEKKENNLDLLLEKIKDTHLEKNFRMIPFSSVGEKNGMLIGFCPTSIFIKEEKNVIEIKNGILGICNFTLNSEEKYNALINPECLIK